MSYTLNGTNLSDYGFQPTQAPGSNVALEGFLDMPDRINKIFHDWGDEEGVEPYLDAEEMQWGGRDLILHGLIQGSSEADLHEKIFSLKHLLGNPSILLTLASDWGSWSVQHQKSELKFMPGNMAELIIEFREPVVADPATYVNDYLIGDDEPDATFREADGIDGVSFSSMGLNLLRFNNYLDMAEIKEMHLKSYKEEGYQLREPQMLETEMIMVVNAVSFNAFKTTLNTLLSALMAPEKRYLTNNQDALASCFSTKGYKVTNIWVSEDDTTTGLLRAPLVIDKEIYPVWMDEAGNRIIDELASDLYYSTTEAAVWRDEETNRIVDENEEEILLN